MKKFLKILAAVIVLIIIAGSVIWFAYLRPTPPPISDADRASIQLMPLPANLSLSKGSLQITTKFGHNFKNDPSEKLQSAIDRFYKRASLKTGIVYADQDDIILFIDHAQKESTLPQLHDDESYQIHVSGSKINLKSASETGIIYGLETLLQLLEEKEGNWVIPAVKIDDHPRYPWRGLMIDVSRHWIPKEVILRNLNAMSVLKMNVFHWHLSDYQGFRVESKVFPKLHQMGSEGNFYSQKDIEEVVQYAAGRGIRVIPEFDIPGHSTGWLVGYPELGSAPGPYKVDTIALGVFRPVMDVSNPKLYTFLDSFIGEMTTLFPDEYFHIGGDEIVAKDWEENESIQAFMMSNELKNSHELQAYFNIKIQKILEKHGKIMMGWDEIQHPDLPVDGIAVQSWRNHKSLWDSARKGNKAILSTGYYLDHKKSAGHHYSIDPELIKGAVNIDIDSTNWSSWKIQLNISETVIDGNLYMFGKDDNMRIVMEVMENATGISEVHKLGNKVDFANETEYGTMEVSLEVNSDSLSGSANLSLFEIKITGIKTGGSDMKNGALLPKFDKIEPLTPEQSKNILGGEACMWTEMVDSITLESRIWPRAAAIAEKFWSPQELTSDQNDMYRRLIKLNDDLHKFGVRHKSSQETILRTMVSDNFIEPLNSLVNYLHEGAFLNRLSLYDPTLYTYTPLDGIVDAAAAESYSSYEFNLLIDQYIETGDDGLKQSIQNQLQKWIEDHEKLEPIFESNKKLMMIQAHSENLSKLSEIALDSFNKTNNSGLIQEEVDQILKQAHTEYGGVILGVVSGLEKLILMSK